MDGPAAPITPLAKNADSGPNSCRGAGPGRRATGAWSSRHGGKGSGQGWGLDDAGLAPSLLQQAPQLQAAPELIRDPNI